ncbi:hypothetical protein LOAG_15380 [Loa loa]|uniref:Uncharacterized protein n=1 Tax=Loa loa TaxID=7209 RepID=A0A1S0TFU7_LOALO|nr:hypothetical protein LOAG_15380 [Loa loa]EFO13150.1 hypothetical protein LOAG_15380 [Loa loa]
MTTTVLFKNLADFRRKKANYLVWPFEKDACPQRCKSDSGEDKVCKWNMADMVKGVTKCVQSYEYIVEIMQTPEILMNYKNPVIILKFRLEVFELETEVRKRLQTFVVTIVNYTRTLMELSISISIFPHIVL